MVRLRVIAKTTVSSMVVTMLAAAINENSKLADL
jgi:hypothetical protein